MKQSETFAYDKVIEAFDKDIKEYNNQLSKIEKQLYKLSINLTVYDWKLIRGKDYFTYTHKMGILDKRIYLLELVKNYLKNN